MSLFLSRTIFLIYFQYVILVSSLIPQTYKVGMLKYRVNFLKSLSSTQSDVLVSECLETTMTFLNSDRAKKLLVELSLQDEGLMNESKKLNMWTNGNFIVTSAYCAGVGSNGLALKVSCLVKDKLAVRNVVVPFPFSVVSEVTLKNALIKMSFNCKRMAETGYIMKLPFGQNAELPTNMLFNNVPHAPWVRAFVYESAAYAFERAKNASTIPGLRMQIQINIPELNPQFDTYRVGSMLELVRAIALEQTKQGQKVKVCVQQSLGEGIFQGMPVALSSVRPVMERMDWGGYLQNRDVRPPSEEGVVAGGEIRLGTIGEDQLAGDDDIVIVISPQNGNTVCCELILHIIL